MPYPTPPTLTLYHPDNTTFDIVLDDIKEIRARLPTGGVISLTAIEYVLITQADVEIVISRQTYLQIASWMMFVVGGVAPVPAISATQAVGLAADDGLFRQWVIPLVLTPPTPLPP